MNNERKAKQVLEAQPEGRRKQGRPRKEWEQYTGETVRDRDIELNTLKKMTQ